MTVYVPVGGHRNNSQRYYARVDEECLPFIRGINWSARHHRYTTYANFTRNNIRWEMHRYILSHYEDITNKQVDHKDRDGLNNTLSNLRIAGPSQNRYNSKKYAGNPSSQYKGVSYRKDKGKWEAYINSNGKRKHLGYFLDEEEAAKAYNAAAIALHGEFARLNEIQTP